MLFRVIRVGRWQSFSKRRFGFAEAVEITTLQISFVHQIRDSAVRMIGNHKGISRVKFTAAFDKDKDA